MDFQTSIKTCFNKYAVFSGRASRSEFWWFALFILIISIIGAIIEPRDIPNLIHKLFNTLNKFGFIKEIKKKIKDIINAQTLILPVEKIGQIDINKKTNPNNKPKLFSEDFLLITFFNY